MRQVLGLLYNSKIEGEEREMDRRMIVEVSNASAIWLALPVMAGSWLLAEVKVGPMEQTHQVAREVQLDGLSDLDIASKVCFVLPGAGQQCNYFAREYVPTPFESRYTIAAFDVIRDICNYSYQFRTETCKAADMSDEWYAELKVRKAQSVSNIHDAPWD